MVFIEEAIIGGIISKIVNDGFEITKEKIKKSVQNSNKQHQTFESQIYNIIVDALYKTTCSGYIGKENQIYDTAAKMLNDFQKKGYVDVDIVRNMLKDVYLFADDYTYQEFLRLLCHEISQKKYFDLYKEVLMLLQSREAEYNRNELKQIKNELNRIIKLFDENSIVLNENIHIKDNKLQNDKKQDYIRNWNSRMFLHLDNVERPITLATAFIMPDFTWIQSVKSINYCVGDTLNNVIGKFVNYCRTSTMLITGVPGIGKSTITSWIANEYKNDARVIILRFRDWLYEELADGLLKSIYNTLQCEKKTLENKVLVLDGFDEMKALNLRSSVLSEFFSDIKDYYNFKCIITSRPAYISTYGFQNALVLLEFDIGRVDDFCNKIEGKTLENKGKIEANLEVLGIPVILYMAIMSGVEISENPTKPELYNRIFAENGGIFDRFFDGETEYGSGTQILRKPENIKKYLKFLGDIAFKMFEKNDLKIGKNECEIPKLEFEKREISVLEFPIKHLFENLDSNIEFIHKSIYEYFVSEHIFNSINVVIYRDKEELACILGRVLKNNKLSDEILDFLRFKIQNSVISCYLEKLVSSFNIMLQDGMIYYTKKCYKNNINLEMNVFANVLEIMHLFENEIIVDGYFNINFGLLCRYIRYGIPGLNLSRFDLSGIDLQKIYMQEVEMPNKYIRRINLVETNLKYSKLTCADLKAADLMEADLVGANLRGANLCMADLRKADLSWADLREANIDGVNLREAKLEKAIFDEIQIVDLKKRYKLDKTRVCKLKTNEIMEYELYILLYF